MLTLKLITEETERVIRGLEKKNFKGAKEAIDNVLALDKCRREAQQKADNSKMDVFSVHVGSFRYQSSNFEEGLIL